jgi:hypothetical protein
MVNDFERTNMTPEQKIKHAVLTKVAEWANEPNPEATAESVEALYQKLVDEGGHWDAMNEIRSGQVETGLECAWSRHYESKAVAAEMPDGSWVGWTYWYGGGKHGEPEAVLWMEDAYALECAEEQKMVTVRTFTKQAA